MRTRPFVISCVVAVASLGVAACGSSSSAHRAALRRAAVRAAPSVRATLNGAGSTFAAPIYKQWASNAQVERADGQLPRGRLGRRHHRTSQSKTVAVRRQRPAAEAGRRRIDRQEGPGRSRSRCSFGAITVSYNLPGVTTGMKLDGTTIADIFLGKIKTWNDPAIKALNPGMNLPSTADHGHPPLGLLRHDDRLHELSSPDRQPRLGEQGRRRQGRASGRPAPAPRATPASRRAVKQTTGAVGYVEQAYALAHNFTYASVKNSSGSYIAPTIATTRGRRRRHGPGQPRDHRRSTRPNADGLPDRLADVHRREQGPCKAGAPAANAAPRASCRLPELRRRRRPVDAGSGSSQLDYAALPSASCKSKEAGRRPAVQRNSDLLNGVHRSRWCRQVPVEAQSMPRGERSRLERSPLARLPDRAPEVGPDAAGRRDPGPDRYFFFRLVGESRPALRQVRRSASSFGNNWNVAAEHLRGPAAGRRHADHLGAGAADRGARSRSRRRVYRPSCARCALRGPLDGPGRPARRRAVRRLRAVGHLLPRPRSSCPSSSGSPTRFSFIPFIGGGADTIHRNYFVAGLILAIMILPIVAAISREVMAHRARPTTRRPRSRSARPAGR